MDALPAELLQRIASCADAPTALAICKTCRALHRACYDPFVFKNIIDAQSSVWSRDTFNVACVANHIGLDTRSWAKYALADHRAAQLRQGLDGDFRGALFEDSLHWAPHLIVASHPITSSPWLALKLLDVVHGMKLELKGVFWYTAAMLSTDDDGHDMVVTSQQAMSELPSDIYKIHTRWKVLRALGAFAVLLKKAIRTNNIVSPRLDVQVMQHLSNNPHHVQHLPTHLQDHLNGGAPLTMHTVRSIQRHLDQAGLFQLPMPIVVLPPSAVDIPLTPLDDSYPLPIPFTSRSLQAPIGPDWDAYLQRHVEKMCTPSFLADGHWCGYYSEHDSFPQTFDSPMLDVRFAVVSTLSDGLRPLHEWEIKANGHDGVGQFVLSGRITSGGALRLTKTYPGSHRWYWNCSMTPFGIFGGYGQTLDRRGQIYNVLGAVWLWKRKWLMAQH